MTKELVKASDDFGISESDMMTFMMMIVMMMLVQTMVLPTVQSAQRYFTSQFYQGDVESKILYATGTAQYWDLINQEPFTPLISILFTNRNNFRVFVAINSAQDWMEVGPGETKTVSHIGAEKRIEMVFYKCDPGNAVSIEAEGHF